jgi:hypothetical protein
VILQQQAIPCMHAACHSLQDSACPLLLFGKPCVFVYIVFVVSLTLSIQTPAPN